MKTIIKMTNEYASNLNCLFFNSDTKLEFYHNMFNSIFNKCLVTDDVNVAQYNYFKDIDIVFIKIDDNFKYQNIENMKFFMHSLRVEKELLPIYLIKDDVASGQILETIDQCYCLDGTIPTPFNHDKVYRFLYRILKRLTVEKHIQAYMLDLERQLGLYPLVVNEENKSIEEVKIKIIDKEREKDLRFSQIDKISAVEFINSLDDTIMDKVENLSEEIDFLIGVLYDIEATNAQDALAFIQSANGIIEDIYFLVDSIGTFSVTARAFNSLHIFLARLTVVELSNLDRKSMLSAMLLAVIHDFENWINVIFIKHVTEDIHYLDASFYSNVLEIENLFNEVEDADDDLEFF